MDKYFVYLVKEDFDVFKKDQILAVTDASIFSTTQFLKILKVIRGKDNVASAYERAVFPNSEIVDEEVVEQEVEAVSYTHLTLPTICSV